MTTWKENLEETKQHYIDWWNHKGIVLNMWEHFQQGVKPHADIPMPHEPKDLNQKWFDADWRADYLDWYVSHSCLKADILPVANTQLGPGSMAAILGAVFEGGEDTIWIHPDPNFRDDFQFDPNHPNFLLHKELLKKVKAKAKGNYYVGMPDLMEGLDVLAAMKGTDSVLLDTITQPDILLDQIQRINDAYFKVFDKLYDIIREGDEMAFCYFSSWAPGKMSKLQSDISTMLSEEDYRKFVQPFIREQCQKIDYTLYHLDGVGAMRHVPALLEIEELNAIQWTPGVGEPQGGSPKWYDLYNTILKGGKSILACWVTLDELKPLLDNVGTDGVHIEMDFHNEDEVEQALKIVEEYRAKPVAAKWKRDTIHVKGCTCEVCATQFKSIVPGLDNSLSIDESLKQCINIGDNFKIKKAGNIASEAVLPAPETKGFRDLFKERILILDGGMGTMIQPYGLTEEDFRGKLFADNSGSLKGCNDLLCITKPDVIADIHRKYLLAGADIIETNTFSAQAVSMGDWGLADYVRDINLAACRIARQLADAFTLANPQKPRFVAGSVGPTTKTCSIDGDIKYDALVAAYREQIDALIDGGVDVLLFETIFDLQNSKAAMDAAVSSMKEKGVAVPIMLSFTQVNAEGNNLLGQNIYSFLDEVKDYPIFSVGMNCSTGADQMYPLIRELSERVDYYITAHPNAGLPDENGQYLQSPEIMQKQIWPYIDGHLVNVIGGCCGTNNEHIGKYAPLVEPAPGCFVTPHQPGQKTVAAKTEKKPVKLVEKTISQENTAEKGALFNAIIAGKTEDAKKATRQLIDEGKKPQEIINEQMIVAMSEIGQRFQNGKAFVPQLLMAGRAMKSGLELLKPLMAGSASISAGKVVIGTVKGDLHDIGKNLVASMLEGCGFEVINVGIDVPSEKFVEALKETNADILCMSALLTTTMTYMKDVIEAIKAAGLRDKVKIMVGGAPVSQNFADEIGADGYSDNANSAVALAKRLMQPS